MSAVREKVHIREATEHDAPAITRIHIDSWRNTYRGLISDEFLDNLDYEQRLGRWQQRLRGENGEFGYVAESTSGEIIGFAIGGPERMGNTGYEGELWALHIAKAHQKAGIGRLLFSAVAKRLREQGMSSLLLWVLTGNSACAFYEKLGGVFVMERQEEMSGEHIDEVAYGWHDTTPIILEDA